ncbi:hypothetical protein ACU60T_23915 [Klebsiella aerogenes]
MPKQLFKPSEVEQTFSLLNIQTSNAELYNAFGGADTPPELENMLVIPSYKLVRIDNRLDLPFDHFELVALNTVSREVVYYNRVIIQRDQYLNHIPVTQILVWRTPNPIHNQALQGLAGKIFTGYLLENYNVVITDRHQTQQGQNFWLARLYEALTANKFVYGYDMISCELRRVTGSNEIGQITNWLWGDDDHYQNRLAIISVLPLPIHEDAE